MLRMTLLRHGKTRGNLEGRYVGITEESVLPEEAEMLRQYRMPGVEAVFCSPMKRCVETAEILYPWNRPILIAEIRECNFGRFEYKTYQELSGDPDYQRWIDSGGTIRFPGGEDRQSFQKRTLGGLDRIVTECMRKGWREIAVVAHGGTIMSIMGAYGSPRRDYFDWQVKNGEGFRVRFSPEAYQSGKRELIADRKITKDAMN